MFNPIKYFKTNKELRISLNFSISEIDDLKTELYILKNKSMAENVVEKILKKPLTYYDIDSKKMNERVDYYEQAQRILKSDVYKNEFQGIVKDIVEHIAKKSQSHEETRGLRMSINYAQLIDDRLNSILDPKAQEPTKDNIHSPI